MSEEAYKMCVITTPRPEEPNALDRIGLSCHARTTIEIVI